jgi:hypothetical protein
MHNLTFYLTTFFSDTADFRLFWWWEQKSPLKRRYNSVSLQDVIFWKIKFSVPKQVHGWGRRLIQPAQDSTQMQAVPPITVTDRRVTFTKKRWEISCPDKEYSSIKWPTRCNSVGYIYYPIFYLVALYVSSNIIAHHQEQINCSYSFWFYSCVSLSAAVMTADDDTRE